MDSIEIDWGAGYVRHTADTQRFGSAWRIVVSLPARFAREGADFSYTRVRFGSSETIGSRTLSVERQRDGSAKLTLLVVPRPSGVQRAIEVGRTDLVIEYRDADPADSAHPLRR